MQTSKLISTISYNSPEYLEGTLRRLVDSGLVEYSHWILHQPEDDETKAHFHVILQPNRRIDSEALRREFREILPGSDPLGCLPFHNSKMHDWILYGAHDVAYLMKQCQTRKHHYSREDFQTTEPDLFADDWNEAHRAENSTMRLLEEMAKTGKQWEDVVTYVPINQLFQYREVFYALLSRYTSRNGRPGHE